MKNFAIHPVGVIVWIWLLIVLGPLVALSYFFAVLLHELGHFCVAKFLGYKLSRFSISPYGVSLSYLDNQLQKGDGLKIAFAGPCANFLAVIIVLGLWWCFPNFYFLSYDFVLISTMLALINLLPAYPLDGGRIFVDVASYFFSEKVAKKITVVLNILLSVFFMLVFVVMCFINFNP
ncbi:MAG: site-2 protease family protein, partial [Clostridia bacterium]|nr:site-2 protease family protein [Clostridia bacterium]